MDSATTQSDNRVDSGTDFTGWLLQDAKEALDAAHVNGYELTIIETAPPRATGPLGDWRVVRCEYPEVADGEAFTCHLWIAQEQLPKETV